jgi:hypothetical protein
MIRKRRVTDRILYAIVVCCIYSFKVVLIGVGESGIRPDDLLIFLAFLLLLIEGDFYRVRRSRPFNIYLGFVAASLLSAIWNSGTGRVAPLVSFLFVVRLLQYMVFYYLGYRISKSGIRLSGILSWYLLILCVVIPLQMAEMLPVPGFGGITTRAVGNTNGPYELAVVAAFLLCYLGYRQKKVVRGVFSLALMLLAASRITFVSALFSLVKEMLTRLKPRKLRNLGIASLVVAGLIAAVALRSTSDDPPGAGVGIVSRLSSAGSGASLDTLTLAYDNAPVYQNSEDYIDGQFLSAIDEASTGDGDPSGLIRLFRWTTLIKTTLGSFDSVLIGLGPSFGSAAVDGYFVRVFAETGLLGVFFFLWFSKTLLLEHTNSSWPFREYVFIMLGTACFIDIFTSYKPMLLLWLWHGMHQFNPESARGKAVHAADG